MQLEGRVRKRVRVGLAVLGLVASAQVAVGQVPVVDTTFAPATPLPDVDLVIVRERAYGAAGVDLTSYGIGTGNVHYVQSIYFRLFESNSQTVHSVATRVVFPPEVTILGIVKDGAKLGGATDDGDYSFTDELFGLQGIDPDLYSEMHRGFDDEDSEFVCQTSDQTLVMGLNVGDGVDDFRVIIDYGNSFPPDLSFSIASYDLLSLGDVPPSKGYILGDPQGSSALGSGDWGDFEGLLGIPLTSTVPPTPDCDLPVSPAQSIYIARYASPNSFVDSYDVSLQMPGPNLFATTPVAPVGLTDGPDGKLYVLGPHTGFAIISSQDETDTFALEPDKPGANVDLTNFAGTKDLYFLRWNSGTGAVAIDRYDVEAKAIIGSPIPVSGISEPRGIVDAFNGQKTLLYLLGKTTGSKSIDPSTGVAMSIGLVPPAGTENVDLCSIGSDLFILRDTGDLCAVDVYDTETGSTTLELAASLSIPTPVGISPGPDGNLHLIGRGAGPGGAGYVVIDPTTGAQVDHDNCGLNFAGDNVDVAFFAQPPPQGAYCTAKVSSVGCAASMGSSGTPSLSNAGPFFVTASSVTSGKAGLLFYGFSSASFPLVGGTFCVGSPYKRTPFQCSGGNLPCTGGTAAPDCSGSFTFDFNLEIQSNPSLFVGKQCSSVYAQYWYRDPGDPVHGIALSNALQFELGL